MKPTFNCETMFASLGVFVFILISNSVGIEINSIEYSSKQSSIYDLIALENNIVNNIDLSSKLNDENNQLFAEYSLDELNFDENVDYFLFNSNTTNTSSKCLEDILYTIENLKNLSNIWAFQFFDSYGKLESGVAVGNVKWWGNYLECLDVYAPPKFNSTLGNFNGKYCTLSATIQNMSFPLPLQIGMCIPDTCTAQELTNDYKKLLHIAKSIPFLDFNNSKIKLNSFECKEPIKTFNAPTIAVIFLVSFFVFLVVLGSSVTAYEYYFETDKSSKTSNTDTQSLDINNVDHVSYIDADTELLCRQNSDSNSCYEYFEKSKPYFKCFCLFTNGSKLLDTRGTEGQLLCIHGIRFLSMSWVILGHTYAFSASVGNNLLQSQKQADNLAFEVLYQGFYSVDSFFVLSGFLLTYLFMKEFSKKGGNISWIYFYAHRYLRLTPLYMIILAISSTIYFHMGSGPFWPDNSSDVNCQDYWWRNLLYINNLFPMSNMCMGWSWYLANDMQFFIISPLFLITLWKWPKVGYSLLALFLLENCLANFFITYHYDLFSEVTQLGDNFLGSLLNIQVFFDKLYVKPYTRIGPYLVGIITGYLLFKSEENNMPKLNKVVLLIGWIVASVVTLTCVYGLHHAHPSKLANSFFNAFNRTLFGAGLSWVIYVCLIGQSEVVNKILSFKLFIPLSRLTYTAYLIHPMFITGYFTSLKGSLTFSHPTMVLYFLGFIVVTYSFSILVSLTFESPIIGLEKLIRTKFQKSR